MTARTKVAEAPPEEPEELTDEERRALVDDAIEKADKLAESELEMSRLFIAHGKPDVARRRLEGIVERFGRSESAKEARRMLKRL